MTMVVGARGQSMPVLALNAGSSSTKFGFYRVDRAGCEPALLGTIERDETGVGRLSASDGNGKVLVSGERLALDGHEAIFVIERLLADQDLPNPGAVGHRIVQGGPNRTRHCRIDANVLQDLTSATALAPLHVPAALALLEAAQTRFPSATHVACLDTAFHAGLPDIARTLPLDRGLADARLRRYGFHGLSCESIVRQLGSDLPARLVIAHLGSGASVTAVREGRSIDTSMGMTPTGGTIMGTRCGDLDPGVLVWLLREKGFDAARLEALIDHRSGLLGLSGLSSDMRVLQAAPDHAGARLAIEMFCRSVSKQIAAMAVSLGGIDLLVFSGGIGEHDAIVRDRIVQDLAWVAGDARERAGSGVAVRVVGSREEAEIAWHTFAIASSWALQDEAEASRR